MSCSVESALIQMKNASHSICVIFDRFTEVSDIQRQWLDKLKRFYGDLVVHHTPEYATVFAGTLFEETYINRLVNSF